MIGISFQSVTKQYQSATALHEVDLEVAPGTFFALVGPSGCGKTTVLRLIAGLEVPSSGRIALGQRVVADGARFVPAEDRGLGMVFQSYALWPHMSVAQNVDFGLSLRRLSRAERKARIGAALELVGLGGMAARLPHELSGGQRQRVALARSLALEPGLILLDEPLANLDAHLRHTMLAEFRRIHRASGTTFVFVTHDQNEAMALADQVGVMNAGRLEQVATPQELFAQPATPMVARFIGAGRTLPVDILSRDAQGCTIRLQDQRIAMGCAPDTRPGPGWLCLRARDFDASPAGAGPHLRAVLRDQRFEGGDFVLSLDLGGDCLVEAHQSQPGEIGATLALGLRGGWVLPRAA